VRYSILVAAGALAVSLVACNASGTQSLPGSSQASASHISPAAHLHLVVDRVGAGPNQVLKTCPAKYVWCEYVGYGQPVTYKACVTVAPACAPGQPSYYWTQSITYRCNKSDICAPQSQLAGSINPTYGNPVYITDTALRPIRQTSGYVKFIQPLSACTGSNGSGTCYTGTVGIIAVIPPN